MPEERPEGIADAAPVQFYRFKVRTSDGRELTSAVALVDPNAREGRTGKRIKPLLDAVERQVEGFARDHLQELKQIAARPIGEQKAAAEQLHEKHAGDRAKFEQEFLEQQFDEIRKDEEELRKKHGEERRQKELDLRQKQAKHLEEQLEEKRK